MEFSNAQQHYTNGFFHGSGLGYQNGHLEGYNMAATEAHAVIAQRDLRVTQLEAMLRAAYHESSQKRDEDAKIRSNMERQWTAETRVATDRLDELICARAEVLDLKRDHDKYENQWTINAEWLIHDLQASRRDCNKWETSCRKAETKVIQLEDSCDDLKKTVGQLLVGDPERPRESQLRCDPLIEQEYQKSVHELRANLDFSEKELEEVRAQAEAEKEKFLREISELTFEAEKMHDHSEMVSASHERFQKVYLATTVRCDELILKVRDLDKKNTNQVNSFFMVTQENEKLLSQLQRAQEECRIEAKACRESKQLCNELNEESRSYKEEAETLARSCERYKESMEDDRQAIWGLNTLNQKLLDGIVSADKWLGKDNRAAFKMMLVRGGAPEDVIDEAL